MRKLLLWLLLACTPVFAQITTNPAATGVPAPQSGVAVTGGSIDGTTVGLTTPSSVAATTLTATGLMGFGVATSSNTQVSVGGTGTAGAGVNQVGMTLENTCGSDATTTCWGLYLQPKTAAASFTTTNLYSLEILNPVAGSGSTITNATGLYIADQTAGGTGNYGIHTLVSSGTSKWNIYSSGTANSAFSGNVAIGSTTAPAVPLAVTGNATITGATITLSGVTTGTNADFVCMAAGGVLTLQTSSCTISSKRFKDDLGLMKIDALNEILSLKPSFFKMKPMASENKDINFMRPQYGLYAEDVAKVDPALAIYEQDGITPKSYRETAVISVLIGAVQEQQREILYLWCAIATCIAWLFWLTFNKKYLCQKTH